MIGHALFLAWGYLRSAPWRSTGLIFGLTVTLFLPIFSYFAADGIQERLLNRGSSSPLLIGYKGDQFDLSMNALYFRGQIQDTITMQTHDELSRSGYGVSIPLYVQHSASKTPIVGTTLEYFEQRQLTFTDGRTFAILGEVVAGSAVAKNFRLAVGGTIRSDSQNLYNIAGAYPMILKVVGILEASNTPDDHAFFTMVQTAWMLDGIIHGHEQVDKENSLNPDAVEGENIEATAAIFMFPEINERNRKSFHLHGSQRDLPLGSVLFFPHDQRSHDQLMGDYALSETHQALRPAKVVESILEIVLGIQKALYSYFVVVCVSTLVFFSLCIGLSIRLREDEFRLMERIGCSKGVIRLMITAEVLLILLISLIGAAFLSWVGLYFLNRLLVS